MSIADELITRGWCQGAYEDVDGRVCLRAAAYKAYASGETIMALPESVNRVLAELVNDKDSVLPGLSFNDAPGRTFDEVLRVAKIADEILDGHAA